ncbi:hypothetical protein [Xanthomonas campestris]|uniref:hypothetical protein n=1 Tax=Xanthomonas campestris TaxID=339 RepID=UPI0023681B86|nr:hypothetical protein [Xanthomonas campestris]MEA9838963.1 hypothetical protein [Xanthomonas campestris pv. raphani]WDJ20087.1 hypothetical protein JH264_10630 [Xanthomonas campestris pv. raphani]
MRDEKDPGTLEMHLPRKVGRPPKYSRAMSGAERAKRYREGLRNEARQVVSTIVLEAEGEPLRDAAILEALRAAMTKGDGRAIYSITDELRLRYCRKP